MKRLVTRGIKAILLVLVAFSTLLVPVADALITNTGQSGSQS